MAKMKILVEVAQSVPEAFARFSAANVSPLEAIQQSEAVISKLSGFGLDSMMATELKNRLEASLHIPVSVLDLLKGLSIGEFAGMLLPRLLGENSEIRALLDELEAPGPEAVVEAAA